MVLCRGFVDALQARLDKGVREPEWKRDVYAAINEFLVDLETSPSLSDEEADRMLMEKLRAVFETWEDKPDGQDARRRDLAGLMLGQS
jgi:hypothetical protein